ncbi:sugar transferase [Streptomyces sp. CA-294286]|uniref:sugar transferase n=1 Tax=Streptomyces sp. CA-294286 TaxID=3240070 RepID=UPI003D921B10
MQSLSAKRVLDLAGSLLLLLLFAPVLATTYAVVALTAPAGPISHRPRAGLYGKPFPLLGFHRAPHAPRSPRAPRGPHAARAAAVGGALRRLALDGLPQLVNVLRGEMSLVGPRPLPVEDTGGTALARGRLAVKPGVTGLWQVSERSDLPWDEMLLLDLEYVDTHCLAVDLGILARTVPAALTARGAH